MLILSDLGNEEWNGGIGSARLAAYAEAELAGNPVPDGAILDEIAPCFIDAGKGLTTDTVALACTHYPLLLDRFEAVAPWPVRFVDPAPAIARRVDDLMGSTGITGGKGMTEAVFTSGRRSSDTLFSPALTPFGSPS